jgi:hypothetical protein
MKTECFHDDSSRDMAQHPRVASSGRRRMTTMFGWLAGGSLGLLTNYALFLAIGEGWPVVPTTFALVVAGFFSGMWLADRLGEERGYRLLGIAAGVLLAAAVTLVLAVLLTTS